jgi:hypothetical protein
VGWATLAVAVAALVWAIVETFLRRAADDRAEKRRLAADVAAEQTGESSSERGVDYSIKVRNVGHSAAREVNLSLTERLPDGTLAGVVTYWTRVGTLPAGDDWLECTLRSGHPRRADGVGRAGVIVANWIDGTGQHSDQVVGPAHIVH